MVEDLEPVVPLFDMHILCIDQKRDVLGPIFEKRLDAFLPIVAITFFMKGRHDDML
jgi:hypothetical protein